ncbi:virginiamycin B lyase, partial [Micromonospora sp. MP36]
MLINGSPYGVVTGPDGALWFTLAQQGQIGRVVPGDEPTLFPLDPADGQPTVITASHDGALWFTEYAGGRVGRITVDGTVRSFDVASPYGIVAGPDG